MILILSLTLLPGGRRGRYQPQLPGVLLGDGAERPDQEVGERKGRVQRYGW